MPKPKKPATPVAKDASEVAYPEVKTKLCIGPKALTRVDAKELLGWTEDTPELKFGEDYDLKDLNGHKVRLTNNRGNRPLDPRWARTLAQEHLNRRWVFNGETIVIGKQASTLSAQHRLVGLEFAAQLWEGLHSDATTDDKKLARENESLHWKEKWPDHPPTMECLVVFGVDESPATTKTLDNVKPRTLTDVLFCDPTLFGSMKLKAGDREKVCRITDYAVRLLWERTGAGLDAYAPRRTHSEALDFIDRHPKLIDSVKHIWKENQPRKDKDGKPVPPPLSDIISNGAAAGLLYLMGSSASDGQKYLRKDPPSEKSLDWGNWKLALEFWSLLALRSKEVKAVREARRPANGEQGQYDGYIFSSGEGSGSFAERQAFLAKAWVAYAANRTVEAADFDIPYQPAGDGLNMVMTGDVPICGGIDRGKPGKEDQEEDTVTQADSIPTPEQVAEAKRKVDEERAAKEGKELPPATTADPTKEAKLEAIRKAAADRKAKREADAANKPAPGSECVACEGTGKNGNGDKCFPCRGTGKVMA